MRAACTSAGGLAFREVDVNKPEQSEQARCPTEVAKPMRFCPMLNNPIRDCYCLKTNSLNIPLIIHFCGGKYTECEIYLRMDLTPPAAPPR